MLIISPSIKYSKSARISKFEGKVITTKQDTSECSAGAAVGNPGMILFSPANSDRHPGSMALVEEGQVRERVCSAHSRKRVQLKGEALPHL